MAGAYDPASSTLISIDALLIAHYPFDDNRDRLMDTSGHLQNLISSSSSPTFERDCLWAGSGCAVFSSIANSSGQGNYFILPFLNLGSLSRVGGFSICMWAEIEAPESEAHLFDFGLGSSNNNVYLGLLKSNSTNNASSLVLVFFVDNKETRILSPISITQGRWFHVCVINKGDLWQLYEDGNLTAQAEASNYSNIYPVELTSNFIGRSNWDKDPLIQGRIAEFRIYNQSLHEVDVITLSAFQGGEMCCF